MNYKILLITVLFTVFLSTSVLAIPGIPHQFYGTVTVNGNPASDGTTVTAKINGVEVESDTTSGGKYGYSPNLFLVEDPNNNNAGKTINFFINGVDTGQTAVFENNGKEELDLSATVDEGGNGNGGGGGGSSGGGDDTTTTIEEEPKETGEDICREKWTCTDWSYCIDGRQTRTCTEQNDCGTDLYKPFEEQPCVTEEGKQAVGLDFGATGRFLASPVGIGSIVAILAVILGLFYWKKKGLKLKKTKSEK